MQKQMLGEVIYTLRKKQGMTQIQLAELVGVSNKAVSKWETDEANPDISIIPKIAKALGVSISELFGENVEEKAMEPARGRRLGFEGVETKRPSGTNSYPTKRQKRHALSTYSL